MKNEEIALLNAQNQVTAFICKESKKSPLTKKETFKGQDYRKQQEKKCRDQIERAKQLRSPLKTSNSYNNA